MHELKNEGMKELKNERIRGASIVSFFPGVTI